MMRQEHPVLIDLQELERAIAPQFAQGAAAELEAGLPEPAGDPVVIPPVPRPTRHRCPWPGCSEVVKNRFWGCVDHWNRLPQPLRWDIIKTLDKDAEVQSLAHQMAFERARNWAIDNPNAEAAPSPPVKAPPMPGEPGASSVQYSSATESARTAGVNFSAGWTDAGGICLFWPVTRGGQAEYLILGEAEVEILRKLLHKP